MRAVFLAPLALGAGCVMPMGLPPLRGDLGAGMSRPGDPAGHLAIGTHLVSGQRREDAKVDVGVGYTLDVAFADEDTHVLGQGVYADAALMQSGPGARTSLGVRSSLLFADGVGGAMMVRVAREAYRAGEGPWERKSRCGTSAGWWYGSGAIGLYAESGLQVMPTDGAAWMTTAGLTFRAPMWAGIGVSIPGCK